LTTLELLDAVEAGIAAMKSQNGHAGGLEGGDAGVLQKGHAGSQNGDSPVPPNGHAASNGAAPIAPAALRAEMARATLSARQFAGVVGVGREEVEDWVEGRAPIPSWVPAAVRLLALLTPSALRTLLSGTVRTQRPAGTHPFSRIEEL
jgi:DNA-binding transcriptional regulator YiaG